MADNSISQKEIIQFKTLHWGAFRLARKFVNHRNLSKLVIANKLVVVDQDGEEHIPDENGEFPEFSPNEIYTVLDDSDLEQPEDQESFSKLSEEQQHKLLSENAKRAVDMEHARKELIRELYRPLHPELYKFSVEQMIEPELRTALKNGQWMNLLKKETDTKIYSLRVFNMEFCAKLLEEVEYFENSGFPVMRPNSMNNYGVILDEIGFSKFFDDFIGFFKPITSALYPPFGSELNSHHAFIVQYKMSEDKSLDFHYDQAEVTLNVCLGRKFTGGSLYFAGLLQDPSTHSENFEFHHNPGLALLHYGKHRHGANAITSGERYNLILWMRKKEMHSTCEHCGASH